MRLAGSVGARSLIVGAACAVIAGVAWRASVRRPPPVPAALKMSSTALTYEPAPATAGSRVVSSELPPWFGLPDAPPVSIFGMVVARRLPPTVHLSLAVPDPAIWPGRDVAVSATGGFDFGPMRRGVYRVSAAAGTQCDVALVDTVHEPAALPSLILEPCMRYEATLTLPEGGPAAGIALEDRTGQVIATTNADGGFAANVSSFSDLHVASSAALHVPGRFRWWSRGDTEALAWKVMFTGTVIDGAGPAPGVGVQPISGRPGGLCDDAPEVVTSDANGRFAFATDAHLCGIRIYRNRDAYEAPVPAPSEPMLLPRDLVHRVPGVRYGTTAPDRERPWDPWARYSDLSPVLHTYVVDPIEVRARGDGPLELVVRLARPIAKHGSAFAELAEPPTHD